jgi:membrane associated rhomboid family serine protease
MDQSEHHQQQPPHVRRKISREEIPPTPVTWIITGICVAVYLYANVYRGSEHFEMQLAFDPAHGRLMPGLFSHMFVHANLFHLASNLLGIVIIGRWMEIQYGSLRYFLLFYISALVAGMAQAVYAPGYPLVGASGGLFALLAAFVRHFPGVRFFLLFPPLPWPVPAWLLVSGMALYNVVLWVGEAQGVAWLQTNLAYMAHLAGLLSGFMLSLIIFPPEMALLPQQTDIADLDN